MQKQIKKYLSLFFLVLFLFPMVEKEAHAFLHSTDEHCVASDFHFHKLEHHCAICDFTATDSSTPTNSDYQFVITVNTFLFQPLVQSTHTPGAFQDLPTRAPPIA
jgi:hypothetical protein